MSINNINDMRQIQFYHFIVFKKSVRNSSQLKETKEPLQMFVILDAILSPVLEGKLYKGH